MQEIWPDERILVTNLSRCEPDCVRRGPDQYFALNRLAGPNGVRGFPRTLAFQSVVEATIPPATVIDKLFTNLAPEGHQLVLFDVNRNTQAEPLLKSDPETLTERLFSEEYC